MTVRESLTAARPLPRVDARVGGAMGLPRKRDAGPLAWGTGRRLACVAVAAAVLWSAVLWALM